jgi:lysine 2,3-aminomutase
MQTGPNWKSKIREAFRSSKDLYQFLDFPLEEALLVEQDFPVFIPRDLAQKIRDQGPQGVLAREFLPHSHELSDSGLIDPIGDKRFSKAPQLIHRYPSRALFTPTSICPVHCRYCFRRNELSSQDELFAADFEKTLQYLKAHPEINEIIFTGGDPLTLSDEKLATYLEAFSTIASIQDVRFHSRYPVILPERLDQGFINLIQEFSPRFRTLSLAIHANHISEFDDKSSENIKRLAQHDVQILSQTVLLKGVNDSLEALIDLIQRFISLKIRPYYLHHPDQVRGGLHFYLPLEEGRKIYTQLRSRLPGWALPHYVIDIPQGAGKVSAFNPEQFSFNGELIGLNGTMVPLKEPDLFSLLP